MATLKTAPTGGSVAAFLDAITDENRQRDCRKVLQIMKRVTRSQPRMWGTSIVGFGTYHYKYESGREGDWFLAGFSPRRNDLTLYIMSGFPQHESLMKKLGRFKTGKSCLYIKRLDDVDTGVLEELVRRSVAYVAKRPT